MLIYCLNYDNCDIESKLLLHCLQCLTRYVLFLHIFCITPETPSASSSRHTDRIVFAPLTHVTHTCRSAGLLENLINRMLICFQRPFIFLSCFYSFVFSTRCQRLCSDEPPLLWENKTLLCLSDCGYRDLLPPSGGSFLPLSST